MRTVWLREKEHWARLSGLEPQGPVCSGQQGQVLQLPKGMRTDF